MKTYDLLVRLPIARQIEADGFRSTDPAFQREIDEICDQLFDGQYDHKSKPAYLRGQWSAEQIAEYMLSNLK
jgi:hypothetical protein